MIMVKSVKTRYIAPLLSAVSLSLGGCIENDIPYPRIQQDILSLAVDGESAKAAIDRQKQIGRASCRERVSSPV